MFHPSYIRNITIISAVDTGLYVALCIVPGNNVCRLGQSEVSDNIKYRARENNVVEVRNHSSPIGDDSTIQTPLI